MKQRLLYLLAIPFLIFSCEQELMDQLDQSTLEREYTVTEGTIDNTNSNGTNDEVCYSINLIAGQHHVAGDITVDNDGENLIITFTTNEDWTINATHLYIGECEDIPLTGSGNPKIGNFEYHSTHSDGVNQVIYTIPLTLIPESYCLAGHAEVSGPTGGETAWGEGDEFSGNSWAMYIEELLSDCNDVIYTRISK